MENKTKTTLYVPDNIKTGFELLNGFGWRQIGQSAIVVGIALVIVFIWNGIAGDDFGFFRGSATLILSAAASYGLFREDALNQSMVDHGRRFLRFSREQQKYKYRHYDPFRIQDPKQSNENIKHNGKS